MKINWGTKLVALTVLFMCFIIFMIIKMVNQDVALIETDYYEKGENYQNTINENKGVDSLIVFEIKTQNQKTLLNINNVGKRTILNASVNFKYLANKEKDKAFDIQLNDTSSTQIDLTNFEKGNWISKFSWTDNLGKHYLEKNFKVE
jgi:hypothetical protein